MSYQIAIAMAKGVLPWMPIYLQKWWTYVDDWAKRLQGRMGLEETSHNQGQSHSNRL